MNQVSGQFSRCNDPKWKLIHSVSYSSLKLRVIQRSAFGILQNTPAGTVCLWQHLHWYISVQISVLLPFRNVSFKCFICFLMMITLSVHTTDGSCGFRGRASCFRIPEALTLNWCWENEFYLHKKWKNINNNFLIKGSAPTLELGFAETTEDPPGPIQVVPKED